MLELKPLSYFIAAYEEGSLTAASNRCHIAQPSISHAIKTLEERLDTQLFQRHRKGLVPTQEAHQLYNQAKRLIEQSQLLEKQFGSQPNTELKVFGQQDIQLARFERLFSQWQNRIPNLTLNLVNERDQADIAFIDEENTTKHWGTIPLESEHYVLVMQSQHTLSTKPCVTLQDIHRMPLIDRPYCSHQNGFESTLTQLEIQPTLTAKVHHDQQAFELIKLGFGLGLVPETSFVPQQGLMAKRFTQDTYDTYGAVAHRNVVLAYRRSKHVMQTFIEPLVI